MSRSDEEIIKQIKELIETHVKPAVANHGGNIEFLSYNEGNLVLELGGACSGCAYKALSTYFEYIFIIIFVYYLSLT